MLRYNWDSIIKLVMWKRLNSKTLLNHPRLVVVEDEVELPNGQIVDYVRFDGNRRSVTVICVERDKVLIQDEYSYPPNEVLKEFPGGGIEESETPKEAAKRELIEECGLLAHNLTGLGWYYINNRRSAEKMYVYLADNVTKHRKTGGDPEENARQSWVTTNELSSMIAGGHITNYSVLAAWAIYKSKQ